MFSEEELVKELIKKANELRYKMIELMIDSKSGHPGGALSSAEIITALYFHFLKVDPKNPKWPQRDRFILSKGHSAPILYIALAEKGFFPKEVLKTYRRYGGILQGHPYMRKTPGIDMSTGTLGQGLSPAVGMAIAGKTDNMDYTVYVILGDGEIDEGQVWEAAMLAGNKRLDNLIVFIDYNKLQFDGYCSEIMDLEPLADKWRSFKWEVIEIDGNDMTQVYNTIKKAKNIKGKPICIICHTIKGKGISFMENSIQWHAIENQEMLKKALEELKDKF